MGLSQRKLATMLDIKFQTVQAWESGRARPKGSRLPTVANALDISIEWLLTGRENNGTVQTSSIELSQEEIAMLEQFRTLLPKERTAIKTITDAMAESYVRMTLGRNQDQKEC